jgi:hypothetical protein
MNNQNDELGLERLAARITPDAMERLKAECRRRYSSEAGHVPFGRVLSELLSRHLPSVSLIPTAREEPPKKKRRGRKPIQKKRVKRKSTKRAA